MHAGDMGVHLAAAGLRSHGIGEGPVRKVAGDKERFGKVPEGAVTSVRRKRIDFLGQSLARRRMKFLDHGRSCFPYLMEET